LKASLPDGVKPNEKEKYLTDEVFQTVFKQTKEQFYTMKLWKQQKLKKEAGIF